MGRIAAGKPVESFAGNDTLNFGDFAGDPDTFALQVRGESMIEDHICDGDYVLVAKTSQAREGDIIVALVNNEETTLKRLYWEPGERVRLQPANSTMDPIYTRADNVEIKGRLVSVHRTIR